MEKYEQLAGSLLITVLISCDKCDRTGRKRYVESSTYAMEGFYETGWRHINDVTYCPACSRKYEILNQNN
jgi:hypothetical protein